MLGELNWRHRVIIQALLSRGPLKEKDLHSMFEDLTEKNPGTYRQLFDAFILKINKALTCANFELRGCLDQYDGQVYYGVVNTVSDEQSKLGTKYTVPQIAFYKAIIEAIVQDATANGSISSIDALNLNLDSQVTIVNDSQSQGSQSHVPSALKNFGLSQKEKTLHELVRDWWLNLTPDGNIKLGVKSFLDLRSWFRNNDVPSCQVCNEAGIKLWINMGKIKIAQKTSGTCYFSEVAGSQYFNAAMHHGSIRKRSLCINIGVRLRTSDPQYLHEMGITHWAELCQNENCSVRLHRYCLKQLFSRKKVAKACPGCGTSWPYTVSKTEAVQTEDDPELRGSQRATRSKLKRKIANTTVEDAEAGCSNQDELNECRGSQNADGTARKRGRTRKTDNANAGGSASSQASSVPDMRRVTRSAARRM